jgi:TusA-related sulfurtransferase
MEHLDLREYACPMNYLTAFLRLEKMEPGAPLELALDSEAAADNVSRSLRADGHGVTEPRSRDDGWVVVVTKAADPG